MTSHQAAEILSLLQKLEHTMSAQNDRLVAAMTSLAGSVAALLKANSELKSENDALRAAQDEGVAQAAAEAEHLDAEIKAVLPEPAAVAEEAPAEETVQG